MTGSPEVNRQNIAHYFAVLIVFTMVLGITPGDAADGSGNSMKPSDWLRSLLKRGVESPSVQISASSYGPQLEQFIDLLKALGSPGLDAALMLCASVEFEHAPALSSRLEIGYWTNDTEIPPPQQADLSASLIPISLQVIYRPVLLHEFLPLYLGGGVGYSYLSVAGSALDMIQEQGFSIDQGNSGLTGFVLIGLKFQLPDEGFFITVEAKHILKTFIADEMPPLELDFDGTAIGMGVGLRF